MSQIAKITKSSDNIKKTKLDQKFAFWYRISEDLLTNQAPKQTLDKKEYEDQVKKIAEFDTIEDFWAIFQHLRKPDSCKPGIEFQLFKEPIKPMWEDEYNKEGGRISIKLRKDFTTIVWEEMIFALIGNVLNKEIKDEINGVVVSSRKEYNILQIWFKTFNKEIPLSIETCIRELLQIPAEVSLEVKQFFRPKRDFVQHNREFNRSEKDEKWGKRGQAYEEKDDKKEEKDDKEDASEEDKKKK